MQAHRFLLLPLLFLTLLPADEPPEELTFLSYNVRNYLKMTTYTNGTVSRTRYKPEEEIQALVKVITTANADLLGLCEIGTRADLEHLKARLKKHGLAYPYTEYVDGIDSVRHLALLSKKPIKTTHSQTDLSYHIGNVEFPFRRGLLHITITFAGKPLHLLGVHYKSKRPIKVADQAEMRLREAHLTRDAIDKIFLQNPQASILLYGDCNDSFKSPTISTLKGHYRSKTRLTPLNLHDSRGEYWTHFWNYQREYSVFDYNFCSLALLPMVQTTKSFIIDSEEVLTASDHRPLFITFSTIK